MDQNEKAVVSVDSDGNVLKCAKGLEGGECGFKVGSDICAKCGAMAVKMKMVPAEEDSEVKGLAKEMLELEATEEQYDEDEDTSDLEAEDAEEESSKMKKKKSAKAEMEDDEEDEEEEGAEGAEGADAEAESEDDIEDMMVEEVPADGEDEEDDEEDMEKSSSKKGWGGMYMPASKKRRRKTGKEMAADSDEEMPEEEMPEEEMSEDEEKMMSEMQRMRKRRIAAMGMKSGDLGETGYVCAIERKAYPGSSPVCDDCPGGCMAEKGMPGILHVEGIAMEMFDGDVLDSGYSADADLFVVDVQAKDGKAYEVFIDGTSAEVVGFHKLENEGIEQKSAIDGFSLVDFTEAAEIAVKTIDGNVIAVEPDNFEGIDAYAVEIDAFDGKSYDVFVALDGEVLGYDRYEPEEAEEIEAEAAEIALKRAFSEDRRMELAKEGMALPDGSYPIVTETDLRNAIQAFGRAKDKAAAKKHIMKRAKDLDMESLIPESWKSGSDEKASDEEDVVEEKSANSDNDAQFLAALAEFQILEAETDFNK